MPVASTLAEFERTLLARFPGTRDGLRSGKPDARGRLERLVGETVPADFATVIGWHDGSQEEIFERWTLLSVTKMSKEFKRLRKAAPDGFSARWVPFMADSSGNFLCLDLVGEFGGQRGQILSWDHEDPDALLAVFASTQQLWLTALEAAKRDLLFPEEDADTAKFERLVRRLNPGFPNRGDKKLRRLIDKAKSTKTAQRRLALTDEALQLSRRSVEVWRLREQALSELGRDGEAADALLEVIALERHAAVAKRLRVRRAEALLRAGRHAAALQDGELAVKLLGTKGDEDDRVDAWVVISTAASELGDAKLALTAAKRAAGLFKGNASDRADHWLRCTWHTDDPKQLRTWRRKVRGLLAEWLEQNPADHEGWYNSACMSALLGDHEGAKTELARAFELNSDYIADAEEDEDLQSVVEEDWFVALANAAT